MRGLGVIRKECAGADGELFLTLDGQLRRRSDCPRALPKRPLRFGGVVVCHRMRYQHRADRSREDAQHRHGSPQALAGAVEMPYAPGLIGAWSRSRCRWSDIVDALPRIGGRSLALIVL